MVRRAASIAIIVLCLVVSEVQGGAVWGRKIVSLLVSVGLIWLEALEEME